MASSVTGIPIIWASIGPVDLDELHNRGINSTIHAFLGNKATALCGRTASNRVEADRRLVSILPMCHECRALEKARRPRRLFGLLKG